MQPQPPPPPYHYAPGPPPPPKTNALVIVLAIVGGVVAIAFVLYFLMRDTTKYTKRSKRSEPDLNLDAIKKGAKAYYVEHASFPMGSVPRTPPDPCCDSGRADRKCEPDPALWYGRETWDSLGFSLDEPHYYQYEYEAGADGLSFTARAFGDLDCDANETTYTLVGTTDNGNPRFELTKPTRPD